MQNTKCLPDIKQDRRGGGGAFGLFLQACTSAQKKFFSPFFHLYDEDAKIFCLNIQGRKEREEEKGEERFLCPPFLTVRAIARKREGKKGGRF